VKINFRRIPAQEGAGGLKECGVKVLGQGDVWLFRRIIPGKQRFTKQYSDVCLLDSSVSRRGRARDPAESEQQSVK
jgi:hypothetical protein